MKVSNVKFVFEIPLWWWGVICGTFVLFLIAMIFFIFLAIILLVGRNFLWILCVMSILIISYAFFSFMKKNYKKIMLENKKITIWGIFWHKEIDLTKVHTIRAVNPVYIDTIGLPYLEIKYNEDKITKKINIIEIPFSNRELYWALRELYKIENY